MLRIPVLVLASAITLGGVQGCARGAAGDDAGEGAASAARAASADSVLPGVEVLLRDSLHLLEGKRVGLITNPSGRDRSGRSTIDLLYHAPGVKLVALFGPEHGLRGVAEAGAKVASSVDSATGIPIYSLYGDIRVPTPEMLDKIDVLVYDIQDVGARVYTFQWTMVLSAAAAAKAGKPFVVLDRPDPIRGDRFGGGVLDTTQRSFVGQYPVALRYGLTPGELLHYLVGTGQVQANLTVVPMHGYRRSMWFDETGIPWVNPSPNLRDLDATLLYTGTVFFEGTNLSEGRGTDRPFRVVGAGWLNDAGAIAAALNAEQLPGVHFDSTSRKVAEGQKWGGQTIPMIEIEVTDRDKVEPVSVGVHLLQAIYSRHQKDWEWRASHFDRLAGTIALREALPADTTGTKAIDSLLARWDREAKEWGERVRPYLIYR
jgi:uncharacterized protein YbbC (DUF1343 family)